MATAISILLVGDFGGIRIRGWSRKPNAISEKDGVFSPNATE
jgi:hypothetical protein